MRRNRGRTMQHHRCLIRHFTCPIPHCTSLRRHRDRLPRRLPQEVLRALQRIMSRACTTGHVCPVRVCMRRTCRDHASRSSKPHRCRSLRPLSGQTQTIRTLSRTQSRPLHFCLPFVWTLRGRCRYCTDCPRPTCLKTLRNFCTC